MRRKNFSKKQYIGQGRAGFLKAAAPDFTG